MGDMNKTEELLESLSPKLMPQELKERIIAKAYNTKRERQVLTPAYRIVLTISCLLLFVAFLSEGMIQKNESRFLASIIDITQTTETALENNLQKLTADLLNIEYDSSLNQWITRHYKIRRKPVKLKTYQDILDILKE